MDFSVSTRHIFIPIFRYCNMLHWNADIIFVLHIKYTAAFIFVKIWKQWIQESTHTSCCKMSMTPSVCNMDDHVLPYRQYQSWVKVNVTSNNQWRQMFQPQYTFVYYGYLYHKFHNTLVIHVMKDLFLAITKV